jgi:ribosomal protein L40E
MAAARDDTDRALTSQQLEAFHKTFNFCMQCRQYICPNCWNDGEGRCLTCAPTLGRGILPAPFPHLDPTSGIAAPDENGLAAAALTTNGHAPAAEPSNGFDAIARLDALSRVDEATPATELIGASEMDAGSAVEPAIVEHEIVEPAPEPPSASLAAPVAEPVVEPVVERVLFDPYDPSTHTPIPAPIVEPVAAATEVVAEPEVVPEPAVIAEPELIAAVEPEPLVAAEAPAIPPIDDLVSTSDAEDVDETVDEAAPATPTMSPLLAGLRPGESLDEALAAFESAPTELVEDEPAPAAFEPSEPEVVEPEVAAAEVVQPEVVKPEVAAAGTLDADALADLPWAPAAIEVSGVVDAPMPPSEPVDDLAAAAVVEPLDALPTSQDLLTDAPTPIQAGSEPAAFVEPLDEIPTGDADLDEPAIGASVEPELPWLGAAAIASAATEAPAVEPEPVVETVRPEPLVVEPVATEPTVVEPTPVEPAVVEAAPEPEPSEIAAAAAAVDIVTQPTWSIVAPDSEPVSEIPMPAVDVPSPTVAPAAQVSPAPVAEPSWPSQPQWPSQQPSPGLPFLNRPAVPTGGVDALWAESDRAVSGPRGTAEKPAGGVQPCVSCGLSLSATARFCRRCGTSQVG